MLQNQANVAVEKPQGIIVATDNNRLPSVPTSASANQTCSRQNRLDELVDRKHTIRSTSQRTQNTAPLKQQKSFHRVVGSQIFSIGVNDPTLEVALKI